MQMHSFNFQSDHRLKVAEFPLRSCTNHVGQYHYRILITIAIYLQVAACMVCSDDRGIFLSLRT